MVQIVGGLSTKIDKKSSSVAQLEAEHSKIHEGKMYRACHIFGSVADGSTVDFLIKVGSNKELHARIGVKSAGAGLAILREAVTSSVDGTGMTAYNMDRTSGNTTDASLFHTPTLTSTGTALCGEYLPSGDDRFTRVGASIRDHNEWILAKNTNYGVNLKNNSGATSTMQIAIEYYEVD